MTDEERIRWLRGLSPLDTRPLPESGLDRLERYEAALRRIAQSVRFKGCGTCQVVGEIAARALRRDGE